MPVSEVTMVNGQAVTDTGYTGTVRIAGGGGAGSPTAYTFTTNDAGSHTFDLTLVAAGPQTISFDDEQNDFSASTTVTVDPGPVSSFNILPPPDVTAGAPATYSISAFDSFGNVDPTYNGMVTFQTTDPLVSAPAPTTLSDGTGTFYASPYGSGASGPRMRSAPRMCLTIHSSPAPASPPSTTATPLPTGVYVITVVYSGDGNNQGSTSTAGFPVGTTSQNATEPILSPSSVTSPVFGQPEILTATVDIIGQGDPDVATPTGTVTFFDGSTNLGTAALTVSNGVATADLTTTAAAGGALEFDLRGLQR